MQQHIKEVEALSAILKGIASQQPITLQRNQANSNTTRSNAYKKKGPQLDISKLNRVIAVDAKERLAWVEPRVTMQELLRKTLPYGLAPAVLPEFKGITVGGAIMGAAIESSSHRWGQFNDSCMAYDILLGDGSLVHATPQEHSDLFYGISGSYGTLGTVVLAELKLAPVSDMLQLSYHCFDTIAEAMQTMRSLCASPLPPDFLEAIIFNKDHTLIIAGTQVANASKPSLSLKSSSSPWFYQHLNNTQNTQDHIPIEDYLFRHDRGAFWMGSYFLHGSLLLRYILEGGLKISGLPKVWPLNRTKFTTLKAPGAIFRHLLGWMMPSQTLYSFLHKGSETWSANHLVIQDFYIPEQHALHFIEDSLDSNGITPIWICPVKATQTPQFLAPHYQKEKNEATKLLFDIGVYGMSPKDISTRQLTHDLELSTHRLGGRKMLYSHSYLSKEEFWQAYPEKLYRDLRKKYKAENRWLSIEEKVL